MAPRKQQTRPTPFAAPAGPDLYVELQVARDASLEDIKRAYRRLALQVHPDKCPGDEAAHEKFQRISMAYSVLSDPQKRRYYDQTGTTEGLDISPDEFMDMFQTLLLEIIGGADMIRDMLSCLTPRELARLPPFPFPKELFPPGTFPPGLRFSSKGLKGLPPQIEELIQGGDLHAMFAAMSVFSPPSTGKAASSGRHRGAPTGPEGTRRHHPQPRDPFGYGGRAAAQAAASMYCSHGMFGGLGDDDDDDDDDFTDSGSSDSEWTDVSESELEAVLAQQHGDQRPPPASSPGPEVSASQPPPALWPPPLGQAGLAPAHEPTQNQGSDPSTQPCANPAARQQTTPPHSLSQLGQEQHQAQSTPQQPHPQALQREPSSSPLPPQLVRDWMVAARSCDLGVLVRLLEQEPRLLDCRGTGMGHTALHWCAAKGSVEAVTWLLGQGVDVNVRNDDGATPLHAGARNGRLEAVEALLAWRPRRPAGADASKTPAAGNGAAEGDAAAAAGRGSAICDLAAVDGEGRTALQLALEFQHVQVAGLLLRVAAERERVGVPAASPAAAPDAARATAPQADGYDDIHWGSRMGCGACCSSPADLPPSAGQGGQREGRSAGSSSRTVSAAQSPASTLVGTDATANTSSSSGGGSASLPLEVSSGDARAGLQAKGGSQPGTGELDPGFSSSERHGDCDPRVQGRVSDSGAGTCRKAGTATTDGGDAAPSNGVTFCSGSAGGQTSVGAGCEDDRIGQVGTTRQPSGLSLPSHAAAQPHGQQGQEAQSLSGTVANGINPEAASTSAPASAATSAAAPVVASGSAPTSAASCTGGGGGGSGGVGAGTGSLPARRSGLTPEERAAKRAALLAADAAAEREEARREADKAAQAEAAAAAAGLRSREEGKSWLEAARRGDLATLQRMLADNPRLLTYQGQGTNFAFTLHSALHWAVAKGHTAVARWLLQQGSDADLQNAAGATPLHAAASQKADDCARLLVVEAAAKMGVSDSLGETVRDILLRRDTADGGGSGSGSSGARLASELELLARVAALRDAPGGTTVWAPRAMRGLLAAAGINTAGLLERRELVDACKELISRYPPRIVFKPTAAAEAPTAEASAAVRNAATGVSGSAAASSDEAVAGAAGQRIRAPAETSTASPAGSNPSKSSSASAAGSPGASTTSSPPTRGQPDGVGMDGAGASSADTAAGAAASAAASDAAKQRGNEAFSRGDFPKAVSHYTMALRLRTEPNAVLYSNRAAAYCGMSYFGKAQADAEESIRLDPQQPKYRCRLGVALLGQLQFREAEAAFRAALQLDPSYPAAVQGLADVRAAVSRSAF